MNRTQRTQCLQMLRHTFAVDGFRPGQERVVSSILSGRDVICILPTGAGKSLCYQLPALIMPGMTLVVSPLIALMRDQTSHLTSRGIPCAALTGQLDRLAQETIFRRVRARELKLLYVSPERLQNPAFAALMRDHPPAVIAVDEAHCVVRWGEAFRPAYAQIGSFVRSLPARPVVCAMTATADAPMIRAIAGDLALHRPKRVMLPVLRENLHYAACVTPSRNRAVTNAVRAHQDGKTIIYCDTRIRSEHVARMLTDEGFHAMSYHAGMPAADRLRAQQSFTDGSCRIMAATIAFGMGVDVRDVRCIIHDALPGDIVDYVQQTGRAGRDGEPSDCLLLLSPAVLMNRRMKLAAAYRNARKSWRELRPFLAAWRDVSLLLRVFTGGCIRQGLMAHFGHRAGPCGLCSACRDVTVPRIPSLAFVTEKALMYRCLKVARDHLADSLNVAPVTVAAKETLRRIAASGCIMADDRLHPAARALFRVILDDA